MASSHTPLPRSGDAFRLLQVFPSMSLSEEIKGDVQLYPTSSCPEYHAVSYCWGDPAITHYITLKGQPFGVPSNLYAFLSHFSTMGKMSPIWVDAICIDQQSVSERNHQVGMMGSIYRSAISVFCLAWSNQQGYADRSAIYAQLCGLRLARIQTHLAHRPSSKGRLVLLVPRNSLTFICKTSDR